MGSDFFVQKRPSITISNKKRWSSCPAWLLFEVKDFVPAQTKLL
jgi:hypothetical protein